MFYKVENFEELTYLNVGGRGRILTEFTAESLENLKNTNKKELIELINNCKPIIDTIQDETIKKASINRLDGVVKAYKAVDEFEPSEYTNGNKPIFNFLPSSCGMDKFDGVIDFLTVTFNLINYNNLHHLKDEDKLYSILIATKITCKRLGILSLAPETICDMLENPESDDTDKYSLEVSVDDTNTLNTPTGISFNNLPYLFSWPIFRDDGTYIKDEIIPVKKGSVWFTQKKYDETMGIVNNNHKLG